MNLTNEKAILILIIFILKLYDILKIIILGVINIYKLIFLTIKYQINS
jgi:hypothetical protein